MLPYWYFISIISLLPIDWCHWHFHWLIRLITPLIIDWCRHIILRWYWLLSLIIAIIISIIDIDYSHFDIHYYYCDIDAIIRPDAALRWHYAIDAYAAIYAISIIFDYYWLLIIDYWYIEPDIDYFAIIAIDISLLLRFSLMILWCHYWLLDYWYIRHYWCHITPLTLYYWHYWFIIIISISPLLRFRLAFIFIIFIDIIIDIFMPLLMPLLPLRWLIFSILLHYFILLFSYWHFHYFHFDRHCHYCTLLMPLRHFHIIHYAIIIIISLRQPYFSLPLADTFSLFLFQLSLPLHCHYAITILHFHFIDIIDIYIRLYYIAIVIIFI
jgi:hypothetical protein